VIRRLTLAGLLLGTAALAGDARINLNFGNWRVGNPRASSAAVPSYPRQPYVYWLVSPQAQAPEPQMVYVEREPEPEPELEQPMRVVVVQLPPVQVAAPVPPPVVVPAAPVAPAAPPAPRVPGPDVFWWTDEDGVVHYSTRVPADARKRAKKLSTLAK